MTDRFETADVAVEDVVRGDRLVMTSDDDPNPQTFVVADVEDVHTMNYGDEPRVVLTVEEVGQAWRRRRAMRRTS